MLLYEILVTWILLSLPIAILTGRSIAHADRDPMPTDLVTGCERLLEEAAARPV